MRFWILILFFLMPLRASAEWIIRSIDIQPAEESDLILSILPLREGAVFDDEIRALSLRLLQTTGRFEDILIRGDEREHRVSVRVMMRNFLEGVVWLQSPENAASMESRCLTMNESLQMSAERFKNLQLCFEESLKGEGFLDASVELKIEGRKLLIQNSLGPRYRVARLDVEGLEKLKAPMLLEGLTNQVGAYFNGLKLNDDTRKIMRGLLENDYFFAEVYAPSLRKSSDGSIEIKWRVKESYPVHIEFTGQRRSRERIRELIDREMPFPQWYLDEIVESMKGDLIADGYLESHVQLSHEIKNTGAEYIDIHTKLGPRYYLLRPQWIGSQNEDILNDIVRDLYEIAPGEAYHEQTYRDLMTGEFLNRLVSRGFLDARVRDIDFNVNRDRKRVIPTVYVSEGDRYVIDEAVVEGFPQEFVTAQEWIDFRKSVNPGNIIDLLWLDQTQKDLQRYLISRGYLDAKIERSLQRNRANVKIVVKVTAGPRYQVARVLIRGALKTDYHVLQNEIILKTNDFFEEDLVRESVSQILRLGIARSVDIQAIERDAARGLVFAVVDIVEAARYSFEVGPGYGTSDGIRGIFRATWANIGGRGRRLSLYSKASRRFESESPLESEVFNFEMLPFIQRRINIEYFEPSLFNYRLDGRLNYTHSKEQRDNLFGERNSFSGAVDYRWSRRWILTSFYELAFSDPFNVKKDGVTTAYDAKGKRLTSIGQSLLIDFLDDSFNPTRGFRSRLEGSVYNKKFGGEIDIWQTTFKQEFFHPLYTFRKGRSVGFGMSISGGFTDAYGSTHDVPVEKRLRLGGESSVRSFSEGSIKPTIPSTGLEQDGGNSFVSFMSEIHIPVVGDLDFLFFFDGGRVFLENADFRPWGLRLGAGPGIRLNTPVGPLKAGYGFIIGPREHEPVGTFYLGVGAI